MTANIFGFERVRLTEKLPGSPYEDELPAGVEGVVQRERWHPLWRQCFVVLFEINGRKKFAFVPVGKVASVEAADGA